MTAPASFEVATTSSEGLLRTQVVIVLIVGDGFRDLSLQPMHREVKVVQSQLHTDWL